MILADENIDGQIIDAIRTIGVEVHSVADTHSGIKDEKVIELSKNPPRIILTEDKDFGEWVFAHGIVDISVILLRYKFADTAQIIQVVTDLLTRKINDLVGKFTVITIDKIRIRDLNR